MVDAGTVTAIATTAGVTATISWGFFRLFNSKADKEDFKKSKETLFDMMNADRADIGKLSTSVAVTETEVKNMNKTLERVDRNVEEILRNGK